MNDYYAETADDIIFKFGLLTTLLSDNITASFITLASKRKNVTWKIRKAKNLRKMDQGAVQVMSSNYVMTPCLI